MDVILGALRHEPRISPSNYHSILSSGSCAVAIKEGHLPAMLKALAEEPRISPSNYHSILSSNSSAVAIKEGKLPAMLEALASSVNIDSWYWSSILSTDSSVVAIKAGQLPGLLNALQNSGIDPQKWPVILKSGCAVSVVKDGNLLPVLKMLATTGIDSGHWHQILNNTTTTRSIIEKPSTFPTIMGNLKRTTIAVEHYHRLLLTKHSLLPVCLRNPRHSTRSSRNLKNLESTRSIDTRSWHKTNQRRLLSTEKWQRCWRHYVYAAQAPESGTLSLSKTRPHS
jgi:hypothetical protein